MQHVPENPEEEFNFYMKFAKSLVLNLSDPIERSRAAAWLKKLKSVTDADSATLRNDYLKLLLFVLQRKRLVGPFEQMPDYDAPLQPFPDKAGLLVVAKQLIAMEAHIEEVACGEPNPYMVAVSSDLKEYAVAQEFNKHGAHCYYAVSGNPISDWRDADRGQFPRGARSHEESIFDTSSASRSRCALQYEQLDRACVETCESAPTTPTPAGAASASASASAAAPADGRVQKAAADSYRWLDRTQEQEKATIDWDPLEGRVEIDKHLETMSRTLEQLQNDSFMKGARGGRGAVLSATGAASTFDRDVDDVFGSKFYGAVASVKKIRSTEKSCSDGRQVIGQDITQGHTVVARDALDGAVAQIHKNTNISDARRQGTMDRSSRPTARRAERSPPYNDNENYNNNDRPCRGSRRGSAREEDPSRPEHSTHKHFEPSPNETIDITTTSDDSNEQIDMHHVAPGLDETVHISKTHQPKSRQQQGCQDQSQYQGSLRYDANQSATPRRMGPALRKLPSPPRSPQRGGGADSCPAPCGNRARNAEATGGGGPGTHTSITRTTTASISSRPKHR